MKLTITACKPSVLFGLNEPLQQLAYLTVRKITPGNIEVSIAVSVNDKDEPKHEIFSIGEGDQVLHIWIPDIPIPSQVKVSVRDSEDLDVNLAEWQGLWVPQRKWKIYIIKASHYDLGYDGRVDHMQREAAEYVDIAKRLCADRVQLHEWHYYLEHMGFIRSYERERSEKKLHELIEKYVKAGHMTLMGNPSGPHWHWMDYEQIARSGYPARREMKDRFGLEVDLMAIADNPSGSWSSYQAFAQSGFKYALRFVSGFRGPGSMASNSLASLGYPRIFYLEGPNGKDRILSGIAAGYHETIWFGQPDFKKYLEAAGHNMSEFLQSVESGQQYGDYPYDTWIMPSYLDWEPPHEDERVNMAWRKKWRYPEIHFSNASEGLAHIEENYREVIPVLRGDTNNFSGDYTSIDPQSQRLKRRSSRLLPFAEGLYALAASRTDTNYPAKTFDQLYIDLVEYDEHCWPTMLPGIDMNIFNTNIVKTDSARRFNKRIETMVQQSISVLEGKIASTKVEEHSPTFYILVWNSLAHSRTDIAEVELDVLSCEQLVNGKLVLVDEKTGEPCEIQQSGDNKVSFVSCNVPAYGRKVYRLMESTEVNRTPAVKANAVSAYAIGEQLILENNYFRVAASPSDGSIHSIRDLKQDKELLDPNAEFSFNQWLRVQGKDFSYASRSNEIEVTRIGTSRCRIGVCGSVFGELVLETVDEKLGARIQSKIILYADTDKLDVINHAERMDFLHTSVNDRYKENIFISFPFIVEQPEFHVEGSPGVVNPVKDALPSISDFVTTNRWIDVSGANAENGITMVPHEASTLHLGQIMYNQFSSTYKPVSSHMYSYAWSNRMAGLTTLSLDDYKATLSYSIRSHTGGWREGGAAAFGWQQGSPLMAMTSVNHNPDLPDSWIEIDQPNVQLTVLKRAEQPGGGYVLRLVETEGKELTKILVHLKFPAIEKAWLCDLVENDKEPLQVNHGEIIECSIGKFDMATIRFETKQEPLGSCSDVQAEATADSSIRLRWLASTGNHKSVNAGYHIYRSEDSEFVPTIHTLVAYVETNVYEDQALNPGCTYTYRIAPANRHNQQGLYSEAVTTRTTLRNVTPPLKLEEVGVFPMDWDRLTVYWRKSLETDIAYYEVYRSHEADFDPSSMDPIAVVEHDGYWYQLYTDSDVKSGEQWYYRVQPIDYAGNVQRESICVTGVAPKEKRLYEFREKF